MPFILTPSDEDAVTFSLAKPIAPIIDCHEPSRAMNPEQYENMLDILQIPCGPRFSLLKKDLISIDFRHRRKSVTPLFKSHLPGE